MTDFFAAGATQGRPPRRLIDLRAPVTPGWPGFYPTAARENDAPDAAAVETGIRHGTGNGTPIQQEAGSVPLDAAHRWSRRSGLSAACGSFVRRRSAMPSSARPGLVVVGASAGGIEALARVLAALPPDFPVPIVIAQHIYPRRPSLLGHILGRSSILPVRTITEDQTLVPGTVFVVPANCDVEIRDHQVSLRPADLPGPMPSVDRLLKTAAATYGPGLVAVILSGSGSDGAAGARVVKQYGGTVIVENPETAKFSGMPQALDAASVDIVADLDRIAPVLQDLIVGRHDTSGPQAEHAMERFLERVRSRSGIDFGSYKRPTIRRRLHRRRVGCTFVGSDL